jgi:hypothetical protein
MRKPKKDYDVGYGKPPVHSRWKPGVSGNPSGDKRGLRSLRSDLEDELLETISLAENGKSLELSKQRVVVKVLVANAAKGLPAAINKLLDVIIATEGRGGETSDRDDQIEADDAEVLDAYVKGLARRSRKERKR